MSLQVEIDAEIEKRKTQPKAIRFGVEAFIKLENAGHITRESGGPFGEVDWASNVPFYANDIYAWCDPSFQGEFELPPP